MTTCCLLHVVQIQTNSEILLLLLLRWKDFLHPLTCPFHVVTDFWRFKCRFDCLHKSIVAASICNYFRFLESTASCSTIRNVFLLCRRNPDCLHTPKYEKNSTKKTKTEKQPNNNKKKIKITVSLSLGPRFILKRELPVRTVKFKMWEPIFE